MRLRRQRGRSPDGKAREPDPVGVRIRRRDGYADGFGIRRRDGHADGAGCTDWNTLTGPNADGEPNSDGDADC